MSQTDQAYYEYQLKRQAGIIDRLNETILSHAEEINRLDEQIKKFKKIAVHVREHCCDDCEDSSMCEFGCAIFELQASLCENTTGNQK